MKNKISLIIILIIIISNIIFSQNLLKEMEVTIKVMKKGVSAQPNTSKLIVKSNILNPSFESNRGIIKVVDKGNGAYTITLSPGNQRIGIKANGYMAYSERHTFDKQKVYECIIKDKSVFSARDVEEDLFETSFIFNVSEVYASFNEFAPNKSVGKRTIFKLPEGEYTFHFKKDGYKAISRTIIVKKDDVINIELVEDSSQRVVYQAPGIIVINSTPDKAEIILDGQKYGYTNKTLTGVTPGKHQLIIGKNKFFTDLSTFEMSSGEIKNINIKLKPNYGYLSIVSHPDNTEIFINNKSLGFTPLNNIEIESGKYRLNANMELYHTYFSDEFEIQDSDSTFIEFELKPAYGRLEISSTPVDNAEVLINGIVVGKTPYISKNIPSGEYTIDVSKENYSSVTEQVTVVDETIAKKTIVLTPNVGKLIVQGDQVDIYLNDVLMSKDQFETMLAPGKYTLRLEKENYYTQEKEITIYAGKTNTFDVTMSPMQGSISVFLEPADYQGSAVILINGESAGEPPVVRSLPIGMYLITANVNDKMYNQSVNILENQDSPVKFVIEGAKQVATTQTKVEIPPKQQKPVTPKTVEKEKKNYKPLYYIAAAATIAGGAYYYFKVYLNRPGTINVEVNLSGL